MDEDEEKIAVAATFGISAVFKSPNKSSSSSKTKLLQAASKAAGNAQATASAPPTAASATTGAAGMSAVKSSAAGPSNQDVDKERLTVDISALRQQYSKLRQRQKQAHIIFTCE